MQTVSRNVRDLQKMGLIQQVESPDDARKKYLHPCTEFFARDAMGSIVQDFGSQWYNGWEALDKAQGAAWYYPMSKCSNAIAKEEIRQFRDFSKDD